MMFLQKIYLFYKYLFIFLIWVSHSHVHSNTALLHQILSLTLNPKNSQGYIWSSFSPFLLPTAAWLLSCLDLNYQVFWLVVVVLLVVSSAAVAFSLPISSGTCKKGNLVPNHISLGHLPLVLPL